MTTNPLMWIGLAGIEPDDNARAKAWERRLHRVMVGVALLAVPSYLLDTSRQFPQLHPLAVALDVLIFTAFLAETVWMMRVSSFPVRYVVDNWLNVAILAASAASLLGATSEWIALIRLARVAVVGMVVLRMFAQLQVLFTRRGAPKLVGVAVLMLALSGAALYWLEPTIASFWDGVWLAFVTATTIGYGDYVATTPAARVVSVFVSLIGFAIIAVFTANVVAFFVRRDDSAAEVRNDIRALRDDVAELSARVAALSARLERPNDVAKPPPTAIRR